MERDNIKRPGSPIAPGPDTHSVAGSKFCECCGDRLSSTAKFCPKCGTAIDGSVSVPGRDISPAERQLIEQYQMNIKRIQDILKYKNDVQRSYGQSGSDKIGRSFGIIKSHMDFIVKEDKPASPTPDEVALVHSAIDVLLHAVIYGPLTTLVKNLSVEMGVLIYNWSQKTVKRKDLENKTQIMDRVVRAATTMEDCILILRALIEKATGLQRYVPASFDLSKHYLRSLEEDLE